MACLHDAGLKNGMFGFSERILSDFFSVQLPSLRLFGFARYVFVGGFCFAKV